MAFKAIDPGDKDSKWKRESREVIHKNPWYEYVLDKGITDHDKPFNYYWVKRERTAITIALTKEQEIVMVKQYRYLTNRVSLELTAGTFEEGISSEELAKKELRKESGYEAKHWEYIGEAELANGYSNEMMDVFIARGCEQVGKPEPEDSELGIEVATFPVDKVYGMAQEGKITDGVTLIALMLAFPHIL